MSGTPCTVVWCAWHLVPAGSNCAKASKHASSGLPAATSPHLPHAALLGSHPYLGVAYCSKLASSAPTHPPLQGHPHVAVAAVHGYEGVLDALCAAGAQVGLKALHHATDMRSMQASGGSQAVQGRC